MEGILNGRISSTVCRGKLLSNINRGYGAGPVSTVSKAEQMIPSSGVVIVASSPIVPWAGTGRDNDRVMGGSVTGSGWSSATKGAEAICQT